MPEQVTAEVFKNGPAAVSALSVGDVTTPIGSRSTVTDAVVAHALTAEATDSPDRAETDAALDALGVKINTIFATLEAFGLHASA